MKILPATPPETRADGAHYLTPDSKWVQKIFDAAALKPGESVLDVGAGYGALTKPSLAAVRPGGTVVAIEKKRHAAEVLGRLSALTVIHGDALAVDLPRCDAIVANPPYRILVPLLWRMIEAGFGRAVLVVPQELAARLCAEPKGADYGRLTVEVGLRCKVERLFSMPRMAFDPPPAVASAVVKLVPKPDTGTDGKMLRKVLDAAWENKERTLRHGLAPLAKTLKLPPQAITDAVNLVKGRDRTAMEVSIFEYGLLARTLSATVAAAKGDGQADA